MVAALFISAVATAQGAPDPAAGGSVTIDVPTGVSGVGVGVSGILSFWGWQVYSTVKERLDSIQEDVREGVRLLEKLTE